MPLARTRSRRIGDRDEIQAQQAGVASAGMHDQRAADHEPEERPPRHD
jgi:hypothetical protein